MIEAIFFDIDGTLVSFQTHRVPESAQQALRALREKGVRLFICTGRAPVSLEEVRPILAFDFDGYITLNGQYCAAEGRVIREESLPLASIEQALPYMREADISCAFLERDYLYLNHVNRKVLELQRQLGHTASLHRVDDTDRIHTHRTYQLCPYIAPEEEPAFFRHMPGCRGVRWHPLFVDVIPEQGGKAVGMRRMLEHYGLRREESMAFGDGGNDAEMLAYAGAGVAMGNGSERAKRSADYITASVEDNGILRALEHYKIL